MRQPTLKLSAVLVAFLMLMLAPSLALVDAEPQFPPHDEPGTAPVAIDPISLMQYYSFLFQHISKNDYLRFRDLLAGYDLTFIPDSMRSLFNSFTDQSNHTNSNIMEIDRLLRNATELLDGNQGADANQTLQEASIAIGRTAIVLNQLDAEALTVGDRLGVQNTPIGSPSREAFTDLQGSIQDVRGLLDYYLKMMFALRARFNAISDNNTVPLPNGTVLLPTSITLQLSPSEAFVGTDVAFYCTLESNGTPLSGREAILLLDGVEVARAATDPSGAYASHFSVPFDYVRQVTLFSMFVPEGADRLDYRSSMSPPVMLRVLYNETTIEAEFPDVGYPGMNFPIQGRISSENGTSLDGRGITVYLDGSEIADLASGPQGGFSIDYVIPADLDTGLHKLDIGVAPKGTYAGASLRRVFSVGTYAVNMTLSYPGVLYLPATFTIEGNATSPLGPLHNAAVEISIGNTTITAITINGSFTAGASLPISLWVAGSQKLSVKVIPAEPWLSSPTFAGSVFVLNPTAIAALSGALIFIAAFSIRIIKQSRRPGKHGSQTEQAPAGPAVIAQTDAEPAQPQESLRLGGEVDEKIALPSAIMPQLRMGEAASDRQRVIQSYIRAWRAIEQTVGIRMEPYTTINEFLAIVSPKMNGSRAPFSELTALAEQSLYSRLDPSPEEAAEAEACSRTIQEAISHGNA